MTALNGPIHPAEPLLEVDDIQGNGLRGFDTQWLELVGLKIQDHGAAREWLAALADQTASLRDVHQYRLARSAGNSEATEQVLLNIALGKAALSQWGFDVADTGDGFLNLPMGKLAGSLGDHADDVARFVLGQDWQHTPDVLLLLGSQSADALTARVAALLSAAQVSGLRVFYQERGGLLPGEKEHFGFRDGISQVAPRGLLSQDPPLPLALRRLAPTDAHADALAGPGQPLVWPGQFVFGYAGQQGSSNQPGREVGEGIPWLRNGSLLVFRRLQQDVAKFHAFVGAQSPPLNLTPEQLAARIVGRWPDGTPVMVAPNAPDPALAADPLLVNHFEYGGTAAVTVLDEQGHARTLPAAPADEQGINCPHLAHVRKVNPRNRRTDVGEASQTLRIHMLRRGIPYGPAYTPDTADADRGLLFLAYQTSFDQQFRVLNTQWMNNTLAPEPGSPNQDLLVGQSADGQPRVGTLPQGSLQAAQRWVIPTGGGFFFVPSLAFLRQLGAGVARLNPN